MNYYYDLIVNLNEEYIPFYEWNKDDNLECFEKVPLYKISEKDMQNILQNKIKINNDFFNLIKDKTILKNNGLVNTVEYCAVFTDSKTSVVLEFDSSGKDIYRSDLLLEDDLNILEISFALKKKIIKYEVLEEVKINNELREVTKIKNIIKNEINKLYEENNIMKLSFLFLEWFGKNENNIKSMYKKMLKELKKDIDEKQLKVCELIKLSYSKI